jgi:DNA-binding transcriptional regulator YhcF (GntR family)
MADDIERHGPTVLPPMSELCDRYRVSRPTLAKAARILREKGLIDYCRGQRMHVAAGRDRPSSSSYQRPDPVQQLVDHLNDRIRDGTYRMWEDLPKQTYFAKHLNISMRTVRKAYAELAGRKLIFRRGRGWAVGGRREGVHVTGPGPRPVILLALRDENDWLWLHNSRRTHHFVASFNAETERLGVETVVAALQPGTTHRFRVTQVTGGVRTIEDTVRGLDPRYLGALVACTESQVPGLRELVRRLLALGRPTAWFDRNDTPVAVDGDRRLYARCHFSERNGVEAALKVLSELGHRAVAYVSPFEDDWSAQRALLVSDQARSMAPPIETVAYPPIVPLLAATDDAALAGDIRSLVGRCPAFEEPFARVVAEAAREGLVSVSDSSGDTASNLVPVIRHLSTLSGETGLSDEVEEAGRLARITPLMLKYLSHRAITSMIISRDLYAYRFIQWLEVAGIRVPRNMSVISFDNDFARRPTNLSSVDFGFGYLGYSAFHFIMQDIPLKRSRRGDIASRAHVSRWGTVGPSPTSQGQPPPLGPVERPKLVR